MINRDKVHELVGIFYQPTYKTFYINSSDGKAISAEPLGVFVSLGITTSKKTLENICEIISSNKEYTAKIVEISSQKLGEQYINTVISSDGFPKQYRLENIPSDTMDKEQSIAELEKMKGLMTPESDLEVLTKYGSRVQRLQYLVDKLNESNGWPTHVIQRCGDSDYRIYHLLVNYVKRDEIEYRIGILVNEKED
jgi:hypothetical protein